MVPPPLPSAKERPTSVTVIGWLLLATHALNLVTSIFTINSPMARELMDKTPIPIPVQITMLYVGIIVVIVAAAFMLRGANWARWLYIGYAAFGLAVGLITSPVKAILLPGVAVYAVVVVFLTRPKANAWFTSAPEAAAPSVPDAP